MNYYNDNEPFVCEWLTNLIAHGLIPPGKVDCRSITDVKSKDLKGYTQCHFFAGIAGWPLAFEIAGWPDDRPVWSASCPCPPFSVAGKQTGCPECQSKNIIWDPGTTGQAVCSDCDCEWFADARHLWPEVWRLAAECRPRHIFGEQVASPQGLEWLAGVRGSMEILGYAVGATDLPAASVGAPHIRQRLWWMASPRDEGGGMGNPHGNREQEGESPAEAAGHGSAVESAGSDGGSPWDGSRFIPCGDGKARRVGMRLLWMDDGISSLLANERPTKKEVNNAKTTITRSNQALPIMQEEAFPIEVFDWRVRGQRSLSKKSILQSSVHGEWSGGDHQESDREKFSASISKTTGHRLQSVWSRKESACSPYRRETKEQSAVKPNDVVLFLSSALASPTWERDIEASGAMPHLREATQRLGAMHETLSTLPQIWRSIDNETRQSVGHLLCERGARWHTISPLVRDEGPARASKLRAYGNAIVPFLAAAFIGGYLNDVQP